MSLLIENDPYLEQAKYLVDEVLTSVMGSVADNSQEMLDSVTTVPGLSRENTLPKGPLTDLPDVEVKNIEWLKIEDFTVDQGEEKIEEFITVRSNRKT